MWRKWFHPAVILFWVTMMFLLIRAEFGESHSLGIRVPPEVVWRKLLLATDPSVLAVTYRSPTNRLGAFKLLPTVVETAPQQPEFSFDSLPEGMSALVTGYSLDFDGNLNLAFEGLTNRLRINVHFLADTNLAWEKLEIQVSLRPEIWAIEVNVPRKEFTLRTDGSGGGEERSFSFEQLSSPALLFRTLGSGTLGEWLLPALAALHSNNSNQPGALSQMIEIDARKDHRLAVGNQRLRCMRLKATLLQRYSVTVYINPQSGEIVRLDLPNQVSLISETLL